MYVYLCMYEAAWFPKFAFFQMGLLEKARIQFGFVQEGRNWCYVRRVLDIRVTVIIS